MMQYAIILIIMILGFSGLFNIVSVNNAKSILTKTDVINGSISNPNHVSLYTYYKSEPAPMGIADYGLGPCCKPYSYNSTSFIGKVSINNLRACNQNCYSDQYHDMNSFQLNLNLKFINDHKRYVYWTQNVVEYNPSGGKICFEDTIFNYSVPNETFLHSNSLKGHGNITDISLLTSKENAYIYHPKTVIRKNIYSIYPLRGTIYLKQVVKDYSSMPHLIFEYRIGNGNMEVDHNWTIYDNVSFPFAHELTSNPVFCVNGYNYTPFCVRGVKSYYDAELIMGGPGDGLIATDISSNLSLSLCFWNGNNYEMVPNAYNFGSDTAEKSKNALSEMSINTTDGNLCAGITNGNGNLHPLYSQQDTGRLNFFFKIKSGYLVIGNDSHYFESYQIHLILSYGTYHVILLDKNKVPICNRTVDVPADESVYYSQPGLYRTTFTFRDFPEGALYTVQLNSFDAKHFQSDSLIVNTDHYTTFASNGTYSYTISFAFRGYHSINGKFTINGNETLITGFVREIRFKVSFIISNLPKGDMWYVNITQVYGRGYSIRTGPLTSTSYVTPRTLWNGTYSYTIQTPNKQYYQISGEFKINDRGKIIEKKFNIDIFSPPIVYIWPVILIAGLGSYLSLRVSKKRRGKS